MADATIRDVARHAEVSVASVSRALNGHANVHPDTRARVVASAKLLGYVPHAGARSLSMARTHAIGVVLPDFHGEFFSEIVRGMDGEATARGYHLLLSSTHADIELAALALSAMRGRVDGLIVMAPQLDRAALDRTLPAAIPAVLVNSPHAPGRPALRVDNRTGMEAMVRHLLDGGRRAFVHITGPTGNIDARERRDGFVAAIAAHTASATSRIVEGDFSEEAGRRAVDELLAAGEHFDAVVAANDMMALGALLGLKAANVAVPRAVAVSGFDDIPLARYLSLTTMRVRLAELGARAVARLVAQLAGPSLVPTDSDLIVPELVVRATTQG